MVAKEEKESIPKRFEDPVEVPPVVFEGLEAVQESGEINMLGHRAVQTIATRMGYPETTLWVDERRHGYSEGLFRGFVGAEGHQ